MSILLKMYVALKVKAYIKTQKSPAPLLSASQK